MQLIEGALIELRWAGLTLAAAALGIESVWIGGMALSGVDSWIEYVRLLRGGNRPRRLRFLRYRSGNVAIWGRRHQIWIIPAEPIRCYSRQLLCILRFLSRFIDASLVVQLYLTGLVQLVQDGVLLNQRVAVASRPLRGGMPREWSSRAGLSRTAFLLEETIVFAGAKAALLGLVHDRQRA